MFARYSPVQWRSKAPTRGARIPRMNGNNVTTRRERGRQKRGSRRWRDSQIATVGRLPPTCPGSYANVHAVSHFGKFKSELEGERQKERGGRSNRASRLRQISPHRNYSYSRRRRCREETGLFVADATDPTFPICDVNSRRWQWRVLFSLYTPSSTFILIFVFLLNVKDLHCMKNILNYWSYTVIDTNIHTFILLHLIAFLKL